MSTNPYQPTTNSTFRLSRRGVKRYWLGCAVAVSAGVYVAIPAIILLNQEWQFLPPSQTYPITTSYYMIEVFGMPLSNSTAIICLLTITGTCFLTGILCAVLGLRNARSNHRRQLEHAASSFLR